jgi:hypothetical protein
VPGRPGFVLGLTILLATTPAVHAVVVHRRDQGRLSRRLKSLPVATDTTLLFGQVPGASRIGARP